MSYVIGVLGGMGTYATIHLFQQYAEVFPAEKEWDRPRIIIDNRCTMPSRVRAILYGENVDQLVNEMADSMRILLDAGASRILLACNTSHLFLPRIYERVPELEGKVIHIIDTCVNQIVKDGIKKIYLLGSEGTIDSHIYQDALELKQASEAVSEILDKDPDLELEEEAIRVAKKYMEEMPSAESYATLGHLYIEVGMVQESLDCCKKAEELYPNNAHINNLKGFTYEAILNEYEEAKKYYLKAAKQGFKSGYYNLGVCCKQSEDFANAEKYLKKYISLGPDTDVDYNYTLGSVYMAQRKMKLGYKYYEKRLSVQPLIDMNRRKLWDGKDYPDKTLLVYSEQGLGDNIQFVRYIPIAAKKFKKVYFATRENLVTLFQESFPPEEYPNIEVIKEGDSCRYNKFAMILDLPNIMHMTYHNVPAKQAYLRCNERTREMQKINYFQNDDLKIGLCWKAMGMGIRDAVYRTIDAPYYFKPLFDIPDIHFYSFQISDIFGMLEKYPQITDLSQELTDFSQTAALLKNIDILITVDTALAHMAGGLGIKTYLLLCKAPDWRWFDNNKKTEWYPSITIIRQKDRRSWEDVAAQLNEYIKKDAAKFRKSKKK